MTDKHLKGRCFCGNVSFEIAAEPSFACHCHCHSCQHASGAPFVTWATFPAKAFWLTSGVLTEHRSSPGVTRGHCADCGTSVTYMNTDRPGDIDVAVVCLEDPDAVTPQAHIWVDNKASWLEISDELPQYPQKVVSAD